MNLTYRENYWDRSAEKQEFIRFLDTIHGLDLSRWDRLGYWDNKYRPFSYFDGTRLVASVCVYSMKMTVAGRQCRVAQISGVGTLPEYRRRGLSLQLTEKAMEWAERDHEFFYLFADREAYALYQKCGFRRTEEHRLRCPLPGGTARPGIEKLDMAREDHRKRIFTCAAGREPVSDLFGVCNTRLFMFWCRYALADGIYYIAELNLLVLCRREEGLLTIYDIVGRTVPPFSEIYPYLASETDRAAEFLFMVDKLQLDGVESVPTDNGAHLRGDFQPAGGEFIIPFTARA